MSRQLRYQRRHAALGLCRLCSRPALLRLRLCAEHAKGTRAHMSDDEWAFLRTCWEGGAKMREISDLLGRDIAAALHRARRRGEAWAVRRNGT